MQDVYERLDHNTLLCYRSQISLQRELGQLLEEDQSLYKFLLSEATSLELSSFRSGKDPSSKHINVMNSNSEDDNMDDVIPGTRG